MSQEKADFEKEFYVGECLVNSAARTLTLDGQCTQIQPRVMKLLCYLAANSNRVVSHDELIEHVWEASFVSDMAIHRGISLLRQSLKDDKKNPRYIKTIAKSGYSLISPVSAANSLEKKEKLKLNIRYFLFTVVMFLFAVLALVFINKKNTPFVTPIYTYLTTHSGIEDNPRFSPDDDVILFSQDGMNEKNGAYVIKLESDRTLDRLTLSDEGKGFVWNPNGKEYYSVFRDKRICHVLKHLVSGGVSQHVTNCLSTEDSPFEMDVAKDGNSIIISEKNSLDGKLTRRKLYSIDIDSGTHELLTDPPKGQGDFSPRYSPDGTKLAFLRSIRTGAKELMLLDIASGQVKQLSFDDANIFDLDWVNEDKLVFVSNRLGQNALWLFDIENEESHWLNVMFDELNSIDVSSDGTKLVFQTKYRPYNIVSIDLKKGDASGFNYLTDTRKANTFPAVSPDKKHIVYVSNQSGVFGIWLTDSNGDNAVMLKDDAFQYSSPSWSPDSQQIAYIAANDKYRNVCLLNLKGESNCITEESEAVFPTWSLNGESIYFTARVTGRKNLRALQKISLKTGEISESGNLYGAVFRESMTESNTAYYIELTTSQISKVNTLTWKSVPLINDRKSDYYLSWQLNEEGIYYVDVNKKLQFFNFEKNDSIKIFDLNKQGYFNYSGLNADHLNHVATFSLSTEKYNGDIGVVENFKEILESID